jgi:hypothetical protein
MTYVLVIIRGHGVDSLFETLFPTTTEPSWDLVPVCVCVCVCVCVHVYMFFTLGSLAPPRPQKFYNIAMKNIFVLEIFLGVDFFQVSAYPEYWLG